MKNIEKKSKRYREIIKGLDQTKSYKIDEAIKIIKERSKVKFIESVDLSINLNLVKIKRSNVKNYCRFASWKWKKN